MRKERLRVSILTTGRFHVCDLAIQLDRLGVETKFYSIVPRTRLKNFGMRNNCIERMPHRFIFLHAACRIRNRMISKSIEKSLRLNLDNWAASNVAECDAFIGMSGLCNKTIPAVKSRYQCVTFLERGSRHILSQKAILENCGSASEITKFDVERELIDYENADYISVLSMHSFYSFIEHGYSKARLIVNPLGVNVEDFPASPSPNTDRHTIIFVGSWSKQKGCDLLAKAVSRMKNTRLLHVGSVGDCALPENDWFEHVDAVDQKKLHKYYANAHVLCLPSRQDGFGMVLNQALASGCKVVGSDATGAEDIQHITGNREDILVFQSGNDDELLKILEKLKRLCDSESGMRTRLTENGYYQLSWDAYGMRYLDNICKRL